VHALYKGCLVTSIALPHWKLYICLGYFIKKQQRALLKGIKEGDSESNSQSRWNAITVHRSLSSKWRQQKT